MKDNNEGTIYVYLLSEGTDVWRPVNAVHLYENLYRITSPKIEDEQWQFESGDLVRCKEKSSETNEPFLAAFERVLDENSN